MNYLLYNVLVKNCGPHYKPESSLKNINENIGLKHEEDPMKVDILIHIINILSLITYLINTNMQF